MVNEDLEKDLLEEQEAARQAALEQKAKTLAAGAAGVLEALGIKLSAKRVTQQVFDDVKAIADYLQQCVDTPEAMELLEGPEQYETGLETAKSFLATAVVETFNA
jgi:hypothetical protein